MEKDEKGIKEQNGGDIGLPKTLDDFTDVNIKTKKTDESQLISQKDLKTIQERGPFRTHRNTVATRSLNNHIKKEELRRIERENQKIARKIIEMKPEM